MNYYTCVPQENGDILLKYNIIDVANYNIIKQDDGNVLLQKKQQVIYIDYNELKNYDFKYSTPICTIGNVSYTKYSRILDYVYETIGNETKIKKHSNISSCIKTGKHTKNGFRYIDKLNISIRGKDANITIMEIIKQCDANKIMLCITIEMENKDMLYYNT